MKRWFLFTIAIFFTLWVQAADTTRLYNPGANAAQDIAALLVKAKAEKKHLLIQAGGNWCVLCYRFNALVQTESLLRNMIAGSYIVYHLNYSKENKNLELLARLGYPQRFGFPVLLVLDANGNRLHTQDSGLLQKGNGYDTEKVKNSLAQWAPAALRPEGYRE